MPAPKSNTYALKHGLYAKFFDPETIKLIRKMQPMDLLQEIAIFRNVLSKASVLFDNKDPAQMLKVVSAMSEAATTLNNLIKTHALLTGEYTPLNLALEEALDNVEPYTTTPKSY